MNKTKLERTILSIYYADKNIVNDRTALLASVWRAYGWSDHRSLEDNLSKVPSAETITRRLRKLHEIGKIVYSEKESDRRYQAFKAERDLHSTWTGRLFS